MANNMPNTGERSEPGARGRSSRWIKPLGWVGLAVGFVLLVEALSKLLADGGHTAAGLTLEIVLAVISVLLIAQSADGVRPRGRHGRTLRH
ncbi:hypothetical protein POF50_007545 [Streptomyces sp. SL13]|uniref:Uncharacterized protein n=1 Tax=Streptantibioticus silvisoli TaxID=2705255 RepID=A0AA90GW55_9ACTN|nr:hypothetical protein [Streptantibioticus silvisoli]MDI5969198.1 hypothetical protein [Streptantibioticus silvisoli]